MSDAHVIEDPVGTVTVSPSVLARIVRRSAEQVDGARVRRPRRGLEIDVDGGRARVSVELAVRYGAVLHQVAEDVQRKVADGLRSMCGLDVTAVNVAVEELDE
jgi:uncharacterized alkaline shock family protein YloU